MSDDFDFDYWKNLYATDPDEADRQRLALLRKRASQIRNEEEVDRLLARVFRQTMELDRIKDPIERLNRLQVKFWKQFEEFRASLNGQYPETTLQEQSDVVVPFKKKEEGNKGT